MHNIDSIHDVTTLPLGEGRLEVVCGPMFSGKTEELLRRVRRAVIAHQPTLIIKPATDTRYATVFCQFGFPYMEFLGAVFG